MAPIEPIHRYRPRSINGGVSFTVLFALIASLIILTCLVWGFVVPFIRKKYFPPKPSRTKYNHTSHRHGRNTTLIQTPPRKQQSSTSSASNSRRVTIYHPRLQTPFPRRHTDSESIVLSTIEPQRSSNSTANVSRRLFTPVQDRNVSLPQPGIHKSYTVPRTRAQSEQIRSQAQDKEFGDAKEFILALPEPLRLRSQTHDNYIVKSTTLGVLKDSSKLSRSADKHLHPNKLFEQLRQPDPHSSTCSSTSLRVHEDPVEHDPNLTPTRVQEGPSDYLPNDSMDLFYEQHVVPRLSQQVALQESDLKTLRHLENPSTPTHAASYADESESESIPHNASTRAMHRLKTYRSLVGAPPPQPLARAGTLTRPKTPVAKIRDIYDRRSASDGKAVTKTASRNDTISTLFQTMGNSTDQGSPRTSVTSPLKATPEDFGGSALSLLPTPLRIVRSPEPTPSPKKARRNSKFKENLATKGGTPVVTDDSRDITEAEKMGDNHNVPVQARTKTKPPPLILSPATQLATVHDISRFASSSSMRKSKVRPQPYIASIQASSVYSRDTQGLSIARTPVTPSLPVRSHLRPPPSPFVTSPIDDVNDLNKRLKGSPIPETDLPASNSKQKVEEWKVEMEDIDLDTSPSPSLKRALSTLGPDCHSDHGGPSFDEDHRHSTISTEINPSEARLSAVVSSPLRASVDVEKLKSDWTSARGRDGWL